MIGHPLKLIFLISLLLTSLGCSSQSPDCQNEVTRIQIRGYELLVEIPRDHVSQSRGLMFRKSLPEGQGMLFVFPRLSDSRFWMRNTWIPLSVAFIDQEHLIMDIQHLEPLDETTIHVPPRPAWGALEVPYGWFRSRGIQAGDEIVFSQAPSRMEYDPHFPF